MNKKLKKVSIVILLAVISIYLIIPQVILFASNKVVEDKTFKELAYFSDDYNESRESFLELTDKLENKWNEVNHIELPVMVDEDGTLLNIDVLTMDATEKRENLLILTAGLHGIEGYAGAAMLEVFANEFVEDIDITNTGVILIHSINPYGMKNFRRFNESNVDLNRNFILDWDSFDKDINPAYKEMNNFFAPDGKITNITLNEIAFHIKAISKIITEGQSNIKQALSYGQYGDETGIFYGGSSDEISTAYIKELFEEALLSEYNNILNINLHTGYGEKYDMTIFASESDKRSESEIIADFNYPNVYANDSEDSYTVSGGMSNYFYNIASEIAPDKTLYSTVFEFGTLGTDIIGNLETVKYSIDENRNYWFNSNSDTTDQILKNRILKMFYPQEAEWRVEAVEDFRKAFLGIYNSRIKK